MKTKTQKGITLIALIITIIVMLILVGVSVSVALNTGLFKAAQGAAKNTDAERMNETGISNGTVTVGNTTDSIQNIVDSYKGGSTGEGPTGGGPTGGITPVDKSELSMGDVVDYEIPQNAVTAQYAPNSWRVYNVNEETGVVTIGGYIADVPASALLTEDSVFDTSITSSYFENNFKNQYADSAKEGLNEVWLNMENVLEGSLAINEEIPAGKEGISRTVRT